MPVLFVGHGSPMNIVEDNEWSRGFKGLSGLLPEPRAILAVSAHWYTGETALTVNARPRTIHDFYGFPEELYGKHYPAPGSPELAKRAASLLGPEASTTGDWGLDHGTWSVLLHAFPKADIPVVQLSINSRLPPIRHLEIGKKLAPLREEGVLILGSGNIVHNLPYVFSRYFSGEHETPGWAQRFDERIAEAALSGNSAALAQALETTDGKESHPTPDHYLPLLYAAGASTSGGPVTFPIQGFSLGSLSMRAILFG
jgi:4,5-DOPA dioxygenase extradiol